MGCMTAAGVPGGLFVFIKHWLGISHCWLWSISVTITGFFFFNPNQRLEKGSHTMSIFSGFSSPRWPITIPSHITMFEESNQLWVLAMNIL